MWVDVHVYVFVSVCKQVNMLNAPHTKTPANTHTHTHRNMQEKKANRNATSTTKPKYRGKRKEKKGNWKKRTLENRRSKMKRNVRLAHVCPVMMGVCMCACMWAAWIAIVVESICMSLVCIVRTCIGVVNARCVAYPQLPVAFSRLFQHLLRLFSCRCTNVHTYLCIC